MNAQTSEGHRSSTLHGRSATRLVAILILTALTPASALGQFLPRPLTTPVVDVLRREAAATYADDRRVEVAQKMLERIYDEMNGRGIPAYRWRDVTTLLHDVERVLDEGAVLSYRAEGLAERIDALFRVRPGYDPMAGQEARWGAALETYRTMAATGQAFADDLDAASETVRGIRQNIEAIGHGFAGFTELGSHQESDQSEHQAAILAAEEMMRMRQNIALQTNADIVEYVERVARDRHNRLLTYCFLTGDGCPNP